MEDSLDQPFLGTEQTSRPMPYASYLFNYDSSESSL
jgi:hypothetical protein